jgi:hypothetical protein
MYNCVTIYKWRSFYWGYISPDVEADASLFSGEEDVVESMDSHYMSTPTTNVGGYDKEYAYVCAILNRSYCYM